ncbi:hypothetical protein SNE40_014847 [Patella caerulea]|uniref:Ubiquitin-like modifier-activating enzyme ATG7 n=1 Tax=Patella caerulea TaxID=87958 RepID=A0AAN8PDN2_PATCE
MEKLQYAPFSCGLDAGFWQKLSEKKLNEYALDETPKVIRGFYFNGDLANLSPRIVLDYTGFDRQFKIPPRCFLSIGTLYLKNTLDNFKECDKKLIIDQVAEQIWQDIKDLKAVEDPSLLSRFVLLSFADLKKYHYYYWFAFPALIYDVFLLSKPTSLKDSLSTEQIENLVKNYDQFQAQFTSFHGYFVISSLEDDLAVIELQHTDTLLAAGKKVTFVFCDPCTLENHPGWPLRNFLVLIAKKWGNKMESVNVLCFRDRSRDGVRDISHSLLLNIKLEKLDDQVCPKCVGWEKNERQKLGPRMVNLSSTMDPTRLCESAVDLNLKLMRWRLLPDLNLEKIGSTKCLLLGSGTLGCNVARCLMGWGVRNITFVDNSRVSYSNPVRQSLFVFEDCLNGGKPKAEAAADSMKTIFPGVNSLGLSLTIPMPGHSITESALKQTERDAQLLEELIENHDAVFLLMDTRESRWLPTLVAAAKQKIVINAALGFDTFLVLRHGFKSTEVKKSEFKFGGVISGENLGCYFCNDVVAPGDSTRDRTLDQQCTVTRPGISMMGAALAVELLVSILQHPLGAKAPADTSASDDSMFTVKDTECSLGIVPHQIRGFLSKFSNVLPACQAFDKCTACSEKVMESYKQEGFQFLLKVFNEPSYLENLTGLTAMHQQTVDAEVWDMSDDEELTSIDLTSVDLSSMETKTIEKP